MTARIFVRHRQAEIHEVEATGKMATGKSREQKFCFPRTTRRVVSVAHVINARVVDMYRVFESLDELVNIVEGAHGMPMTASCMVPRNEVLALLDELRNALPVEVDDAQDVLDKQDQILAEAAAQAEHTVATANAEATDMVEHARAEAERTLADADQRAADTIARAEADADHIVTKARDESDRTIALGNETYERAVAEGQAEQARLVSEAEVVSRANEEAHRIVDAANSESTRLRQECDDFVDSKLAQFEESLGGILRTVSADRTALRRGAGAVGSAGGAASSVRPRHYGD